MKDDIDLYIVHISMVGLVLVISVITVALVGKH